jgi:serine/threonine protein kinase
MEKCERDLQKELKKENLNFDERKKIATGVEAGFQYLKKIGIDHCDRKLSNFLLIGGEVKICDFGLVQERSGRRSYRQLGYARRGSKYKNQEALCKFWNVDNFKIISVSGTPGFTGHFQLGGFCSTYNDYILYLFCDWKTIWSLKYRPIGENQRQEIDKIVQVRKYRHLFFSHLF